ncbi:MAG: SGNH/GDSL hydrolase family protein [Clostridia bacterium]|nr:SGNH/GDSL hydrolase family protein [Clostridia bacterium]
MLRKLISLLLVVMCMGLCLTGMGEKPMNTDVYMGRDAADEWYLEMLADGLVRAGNPTRLQHVIERAKAGETVTLATIGGSITEGAGASQYKECWAYRFMLGMRALCGAGDGTNVRFVNAGVGGTPSTFGWMRYERDVVSRVQDDDNLPDVVVIEFAVNDYNEPSHHQCYEAMVKDILSQPNEPAVILLFSVFQGGFNLQDEIRKIGDTYDLLMVSIRDAAYPHVGKEWTEQEFFHDQYHPTSFGHAIMADCMLYGVQACAAQETPEKDIDLDVPPAYGLAYAHMTKVFGDSDTEALGISRGGFAHDDTTTYRNTPVGRVCGSNFHHNAKDGSEPLTFTAEFSRLLISWKNTTDASYGAAEVWVDGTRVATLRGQQGSWGQSETSLVFTRFQTGEHTVEIRMAEGSENKLFTITCIGIVE